MRLADTLLWIRDDYENGWISIEEALDKAYEQGATEVVESL